jgi:pimeloyl-ACP methyl ester carboxylesterase
MPKYHSFGFNFNVKQISNRRSIVYLSRTPGEKLLIFIHGFGGHPTKTWSGFPAMLLDKPELADYDFIYYNYDSKHVQATFSGIALHDFIGDLMNKPNYFSFTSTIGYERTENFRYRKITLVAHSLGSIICRFALNRSYAIKSHWHEITNMVLFAPAHMGAMALRSLVHLFYSLPIAFVADVVRYNTVTMNDVDLSLTDCSLHYLIAETKNIQQHPDHSFTIAEKVIWAEYERIVNNHKFLKDSEPSLAFGKDHMTICKPDQTYIDPIDLLIAMTL